MICIADQILRVMSNQNQKLGGTQCQYANMLHIVQCTFSWTAVRVPLYKHLWFID